MSRVLLTGGSGFIATHVLELLLQRGYSVVTTVRSQDKWNKIKARYPNLGKGSLDFTIVEDIARLEAFDDAVISSPPFDIVIHTASPFQYNVKDIQKDLIDPAVNGTIGILQAIKKSAPNVKTVVITSSFAALSDASKGNWPEHTFTEGEWNPITLDDALSHPARGYTGSKAFAEKAAWSFMQKEKPKFMLSTINPVLVFGPIVPELHSLQSLNTSNQILFGITKGMAKEKIPDIGGYNWVDVRDVALAHVKAAELPAAANKRFLLVAGQYNNRLIVEIIRKNFPEYESMLPPLTAEGGDFPKGGVFRVSNAQSQSVLGIQYKTLEQSVVDTIKSFQAAS